MRKQIAYNIFFIAIISFVFLSIISTINWLSIDRIELNQRLKEKQSLLYTFDISVPASASPKEVEITYDETIISKNIDEMTFYVAIDKVTQQKLGYGIKLNGRGVWGPLTGFVVLSPDLESLSGIDIVSHSETPGLGGRITEDEYREQFRGVVLNKEGLPLVYRPSSMGNVDSITGATGSSRAVLGEINNHINILISYVKEGKLDEY